MCVDVADGGPPVTGAQLLQERCGPGGPALCMVAGNLGGTDQTPLVAASCQGFGNAAEILELG